MTTPTTPPIAITGYGIISAIGCNAAEVLQSLENNRSGIAPMRHLGSVHNSYPVGEVKRSNDQLKAMLGIDATATVSRTVLLGGVAAREALADALLQDSDCQRAALVTGTTVGGMDTTEAHYREMLKRNDRLDLLLRHDCGSSSDEIAALCGLQGEVCTISTACSSALNAIMTGCELLRRGEADVVVAGGSESLSLFHFNGFRTLMILDEQPCRPFDAQRAGINLGEGAAYVVLERADDAKRRGADIRGYVAGYANRCDAFHQTATSDNGEGAYLAMTEALRHAGIDTADIDYINAHGTGTDNNDRSESVALRRVFGDRLPSTSSTKGFTGHTTSASGAIETVVCLMAMSQRFVPANIGWTTAMNDGIVPSMGRRNVDLRHVLCNSFGFGGNCSSIVISRDEPQGAARRAEHKWRVAATVEIGPESDLKEVRDYVAPMEARRMGKLLKAATLAAQKALSAAGIERPDAIVSATALGMLETSERFLDELTTGGEQGLSPTLFIQSTHNTIGSSIAIRNNAHGYNTTYTQGERSMQLAMRDAERLIEDGLAQSVLVGCYDESTTTYNSMLQRLGKEPLPMVRVKCVVLTSDE